MKAMILAAGLGTRLRPLTNDRPKALVEVGGRTLLEITLARLRDFGIRDVIINVHHFAERIESYLKAKNDFGMHIELSREEVLLDTGGGLKKAGYFFLDSGKKDAGREVSGREGPFLLHNADVISNIDFKPEGEKVRAEFDYEGIPKGSGMGFIWYFRKSARRISREVECVKREVERRAESANPEILVLRFGDW